MISLRKINSILVIIMILMLVNHAVLSILYLYGLISYSPSFQITGRRLFYPLILHIIISSYLFIKDKRRNVKTYPKLISQTTKQIISGIAIVIFVALHIISYMTFSANSNSGMLVRITHFLIDCGMFASVCIHLKISIPRLAISLGFLENKNEYDNFKGKTDKIMIVILIIMILAEIIHYLVII